MTYFVHHIRLVGWFFMAQSPEITYCARQKTLKKLKRKIQRRFKKKDLDGIPHQEKSNKKKNKTIKVIMQKVREKK